MANTFKNDTFRSGQFVGNATLVVFGLLILLSVLGISGSGWLLASPDSSLEMPSGEAIHGGELIVGFTQLFQFGLRFICIVLFLIWLHRSFNNLPVIGARNLEFSPGWAVGWWFIPFANFVQPYRVVKELYRESQQAVARAGKMDTYELATENVGLWWAAFLLSGFVLRISDNLFDQDGGDPSMYFPVAFLTGQMLFSIAAVLAIVIIRDVNSWQHQAIASIKPVQDPPPPPSFEKDRQL